jgi:hypothetical protein
VHGAGGNLSIKPGLHLVENRPAIGLLPQTKNGEQYSLLEIAKKVSHKTYNVVFVGECQAVRVTGWFDAVLMAARLLRRVLLLCASQFALAAARGDC